ncbi:MAG: PVC-type heme-binding CxxCH protein [Candidatus Hydrogenedentes bacterium]|nr:PVC-type heme-binding CxxCH protein [Candidatus Hydrogenedentota bacterium]
MFFLFRAIVCFSVGAFAFAHDANRLAYLDESDPFYVHRDFPKLITPQWIGEPGVEAAIILSIDDMRDPAKYEEYLRPIINKLEEHYGTAAMSIMACSVTPDDPRFQVWLKEGLSIETHTVAHPCPLLGQGNFDAAKATYESCVELINAIPGNKPVAFRMPCCDSINSLSPRFFAEIFNKPEPGAPFLAIDSSVFNITTANDASLPREWVLREDGRERFRTYLPFPSFKTTIEDYPYPYIIGGTCWEFPCAVPSDWEAQNINKPNSPHSLADMKIALDAAVAKRGVYTLVFHPHGWIRNDQVVELIEHARNTYGSRVRFLSFRDAYDCLNKNLLGNLPLRSEDGTNSGTRLADINNDGYIDVVTGSAGARIWRPDVNKWHDVDSPLKQANALRFGIDAGNVMAIMRDRASEGAWTFRNNTWEETPKLLSGLKGIATALHGRDNGVRFRDIDGDGNTELMVLNDEQRRVFTRAPGEARWKQARFAPPVDAILVDAEGNDNGLRFIDLDGDHDLDLLVSNEQHYAVHLFDSMKTGWSKTALQGIRDSTDSEVAIPAITINGQNNGAWIHSRHLWVQNEHTDKLPDLVDRRSFSQLLADAKPEPKSPEAGLASIQVHAGLKVELVASEPQVQDPVAIAWGADGKLWVTEMRDYPLGMDGEGKPGSRVKYLEDVDGDGYYEKSTLFLDDLAFATGVFPWRDGVIITAAPLIFFARDTDGDGKADEQTKMFSGFGEVNQQHRVNGLRWGLDNWLHGANGDGNGAIVSEKTGETVNISGRDLRIRPDTGVIDPESGQTQFGIAFDDWGSRFGCANWLPVWHFALEDAPMRRNPHFSPGNPREYIVEQAQLYPTSRTLGRFNDFEHVNRSTSTCGLDVYRDTLLGAPYAGNIFVCEPVHNLVLRSVLEPNGYTFSAHRAPGEEESEFLSSTDNWFRPVMVRAGPDGALYVVDMYREVIEHPEYISKETQATLDLRAGDDMGRIYRVVPVHHEARAAPRLDSMTTGELVETLHSPNGSLRDMAHQLIFERVDNAAIAPMQALLRTGNAAQARVHALCALDGLNALTNDDIRVGLADAAPGVRRHAVRLAAERLVESPELEAEAIALHGDDDNFVRMQVIYALARCTTADAVPAFQALISADVTDSYAGLALLSAINASNVRPLVPALMEWSTNSEAAPAARDQLFGAIVGTAIAANDNATLLALANAILSANTGKSAEFDLLARYVTALESKGVALDALGKSPEADSARAQIAAKFADARAIAANAKQDEALRASAIALFGHDPAQRDADVEALTLLIASQDAVAVAALDALIATGDARVPDAVFAGWPKMQQESRALAMNALLKRDEWVDKVIAALSSGSPSVRELDAEQRQRLLNSGREEVRAAAESLMKSVVNADRQAVLEQYAAAEMTPGQFLRGRHIFRERCASCHHIGDVGHDVGPDLGAITDRSPQSLLVSILDPNRAVETKYFDYRVETNDLQTLNGIVTKESGNSITLRSANGIETVLLRSDIETIESTNRSPMPDGLEDGLSVEDMANLVAFILDIKPAE